MSRPVGYDFNFNTIQLPLPTMINVRDDPARLHIGPDAVGDGATDDWFAFQSVIDACYWERVAFLDWGRFSTFFPGMRPFEKNYRKTGSVGPWKTPMNHVLFVPGSPNAYCLSLPLCVDVPGLSIIGDGKDVTLLRSTDIKSHPLSHDVIQFGPERPADLVSFYKEHYLSEATLASVWIGEKRFPIRTRGDSYLYFHGTPFDRGPPNLVTVKDNKGNSTQVPVSPNWKNTQKLTIDMCIQADWNYLLGKGFRIFGIGDPTDGTFTPQPFYCEYNKTKVGNSGVFRFAFSTADSKVHQASFTFDPSSSEGRVVRRITFQVDLTQPVAGAFLDRRWMDPNTLSFKNWNDYVYSARDGAGPWSLSGGEQFSGSEYSAMTIGDSYSPGHYTDSTGAQTTVIADVDIMGFKMAADTLYTPNPKDGVQIRNLTLNPAQAPLDDGYEFYKAEDQSFSVYLRMNDQVYVYGNPYRHVQWVSGGSYGHGLHLSYDSLSIPQGGGPNLIRDLHLLTDGLWGRPLAYGPTSGLTIEDSVFEGGSHNLGAFNGADGYPIRVRGADFVNASDASIYAQQNGYFYADQVVLFGYGRTAMRTLASFVHLNDVPILGKSQFCENQFKFHLSQGGILENVGVDSEDSPPIGSYVWCEVEKTSAKLAGTLLTLRNFGGDKASAYIVDLVGSSDTSTSTGKLVIENVNMNDNVDPAALFRMVPDPAKSPWKAPVVLA